MKKPILFFLIGLGITTHALGKSDNSARYDSTGYHRGFAMYLIFPKIEFSSFSQLNPFLFENDFPMIPRQTYNWGLGLQYRSGSFLINLDAMLAGQGRENSLFQTELNRSVVSSNLNFGRYVYKRTIPNTLAIYPFTGISTNQTTLFLSRPTTTLSIEELLSSPRNTSKLEHFAVGINVGIGVDLTTLDQEGLYLLGLRIGYRFSPEGAYPWESSLTQITNAPMDTFNHFFVQLNLGGGLNWRKS